MKFWRSQTTSYCGCESLIRTVMMGSKGPNISSLIIRESRGTSNRTVGLILLGFKKTEKFVSILYFTKSRRNQWSTSKKEDSELTICFYPFHLHEQSYQKLYHHPKALSSDRSGLSLQYATNLLIPMDSFHKTALIRSLEHPPRNRRNQTLNTK